MAERLRAETSPYLLQHVDDPVDWYPWGEEAFEEARRTDRPVLLSIGYSSCHWCHVMARESFRDARVAALMNERFVNVKVDREERPDVDEYYMTAVQALTGAGGWPMTVFLTPDAEPFSAGTYYPPTDRHGLPSFTRVIDAVHAAWRDRRGDVTTSAGGLADAIRRTGELTASSSDDLEARLAEAYDAAVETLAEHEDRVHGGFGDPAGGPKFPPHSALALLLSDGREAAIGMATRALSAMARGGIWDHVAGGFFRYSIDPAWRVPHFEKMLGDNAQLVGTYADAYGATGRAEFREVSLRIVDWLSSEMAADVPAGQAAFFTALDADSAGEEGAYYGWTPGELRAALGGEEPLVTAMARRYGVTASPDFEGGSVLRLAADVPEVAAALAMPPADAGSLLEEGIRRLGLARSQRVRPAVDDKVLTSLNGLLVSSLARAGTALREPSLHALAGRVARFLEGRTSEGGLTHSHRRGEDRVTGLLEDHAFLGCGLLDLYHETLEPALLLRALELAREVEERFADPDGPGWFDSDGSGTAPPARLKGITDGAVPSRYVSAARLVHAAGRYLSDRQLEDRAREALVPLLAAAGRAPQALGSVLPALRAMTGRGREVVFVGEASDPVVQAALAEARGAARTGDVLVLVDPAHETGSGHPLAALPLVEGRYPSGEGAPTGRGAGSQRPTFYVCSGGVCRLPVHDANAVRHAMLAL